MATNETPTLDELKAIIKAEGLKIRVVKDADPKDILAKIEKKRAKLAKGAEGGNTPPTPETEPEVADPQSQDAENDVELKSVNEIQKLIDKNDVNLRITKRLAKDLKRLNELYEVRLKEKK